MVEVIGKDPTVYKTISCSGCASILRYTEHELKERPWADYSGDSGILKYIDCPDCNKKVTIRY